MACRGSWLWSATNVPLSGRRGAGWCGPRARCAQMFSSEDPEKPARAQFDLAWCDELGKWRHARETWDMLAIRLEARRKHPPATG